MKLFYLLAFSSLIAFLCNNPVALDPAISQPQPLPNRMGGLNFVAPPRAFDQNPMPAVQKINANWIAVIPYAYSPIGKPVVVYNPENWQQWWGERPEGVRKTIALAQEANIKIMLKPQVYVPGSWPGGLEFNSEEDWVQWEKAYEAYLMPFVEMADSFKVDLFCIGTEFKISVQKRPQFWRQLIKKVKQVYDGPLVYAANWDEYPLVPFWDELDYVGVDAYFPLVKATTPAVKDLKKAWEPIIKKLRNFHKKTNKPILFTEYGYLSVDGCAYNTWELEANIQRININEQAQANALEALYSSLWHEPFWAGGFIWKWFPNMKGHEGYPGKDYTPQGKKGEAVVQKWYQQTLVQKEK